MTLTHIKITHAKPSDRAYKLADSDALYLVVNPNGAKLWRMNYRYLGRKKTLHFGEWPTVTLSAGNASSGDEFASDSQSRLGWRKGGYQTGARFDH